MAKIVSERHESSEARVPAVRPGTALVFTRYDREKAVVMHPEDFHRLDALDRDLDEIASARPVLDALAEKVHALEDTSGTPVEDPEQLKALFDL